MDRITVSQTSVDACRVSDNAEVAAGIDDPYTDKIDASGFPTDDPSGLMVDRRDRPHVVYYQAPDGSWQPTPLKNNDDVQVYAGAVPPIYARVIGPANQRDWFSCWVEFSAEPYDKMEMYVNVVDVADRAPVDPNETPMPLIPIEQIEAFRAQVAAKKNPKQVAKAERQEARALRHELRDLVAAQPKEKRKQLREALVRHGLLGKDDE